MSHPLRVPTVVIALVLGACRPASPPQPEPPATVATVATAPSVTPDTITAHDDSAPPPYTLANTEVHAIRAQRLGRSYPLLVSLPRDYASSAARRYPVLFVTDVNYAFPLVRSIGAMVGDKGAGLEDFILVGLGYADGDSPPYSRRRDYTPTPNGPRNVKPDESGRPPLHGEAEAYRRFIADEIFPFVDARYRTDPARRIFAGHSYGALLGTHMLLTEPRMFERYILSSPSLWYDNRIMLARERDYAAAHDDLPANVFFAIGSYETVKPGSNDPRYNREDDMVADLNAFEAQLRARRYPSLQIASTRVPDEDHLGAYPTAITRGLRWALPPR